MIAKPRASLPAPAKNKKTGAGLKLPGPGTPGFDTGIEKKTRIKKLEEKLGTAKAEMKTFVQEREAFSEELEISKEEIGSTNGELITSNRDLQTRNGLLNESYKYSEAIIATVPDPLLILDKNLRVISANKIFYKTFKVNQLQTEGSLLYNLGNKQWNIPALRQLLDNILPKNKQVRDYEVSHNFPGIGHKTMLLNASRITQHACREQLILLIIKDVTEQALVRRMLEESEKRFKSLIYGLPIGIYQCNAKGDIELFNESAAKLWGRVPKAGKDKWCGSWKLYNTEGVALPQQECPMAIAIKKGTTEARELLIEQPGGARYSVIFYPQLIYNAKGKITGAVNTIIDITAQVEVRNKIEESETKFRELSLSLEQKVKDRTVDLITANETLEEKNDELQYINKELQSFTYVASHDLKEPLRKIQTLAGRIIQTENESLSGKGKDALSRMREAAQRMQALIEDILSFSRLTISDRKFETVDVKQLIEQVVSELKEIIDQKSARIEIGDICDIRVIPFQFHQLMTNLVGNALKYARPAVPSRISISSKVVKYSKLKNLNLPRLKEYCLISIRDNGIGFEPRFSEKIFEVFQKLHSRDEYPGTGIGLAIVRKIVENHNGVITATGELDKGATFDIYIPL